MTTICGDGALCIEAASATAIRSVAAALLSYSGAAPIVERACQLAVAHVGHCTTTELESFAAAGGHFPFVAALGMHADSADIVLPATRALYELLVSNACMAGIVAVDGIATLLAALSRHAGSAGIAEIVSGAICKAAFIDRHRPRGSPLAA